MSSAYVLGWLTGVATANAIYLALRYYGDVGGVAIGILASAAMLAVWVRLERGDNANS